MDDAEIVERLLADPRLLRLPLVRLGNDVTAGPAEATWKAWLAADRLGHADGTRSRTTRRAPHGAVVAVAS